MRDSSSAKQTTPHNKRLHLMYALSAYLFVFALSYTSIKTLLYTHIKSTPTVEDNLRDASIELNSKAPYMVDSVTQFSSAMVLGNELDYIINYTGDGMLSQNDLDTKLKPVAINKLCTTSETREMLDNGATLGYRYYDRAGINIGKYSIIVSDCHK